jgi:hypothetical protein
LRGVGTVTVVGMTTRVAVAATATAAALVVGAVGLVLAVDERRRAASNIASSSSSSGFCAERHAIDARTDPNSDRPSASSASASEHEKSGCE